MITKILKKDQMMKEFIKFWFFHWISIWDYKLSRWFFSKIWLWIKKRGIIEKITKFDHMFDTKDYVLCVVYNEIENLSSKLVILQTKKKCQFFSTSEIVDRSINARNESINSNKIKSIVFNVLSLITQKRFRFSFDWEDVFSMARRKILKKHSKDRSFNRKKLFENSNNSFRFEIKEQVILFESINKMIQENEAFVTGWPRREENECGISHPVSREKNFFSISLLTWKKIRKKMNFYLLKWAKSVIFCEKRRDSFPTSHCGKKKISISLPPWGKGNFFGGFPFPHVGREEIVFPFPFPTTTLIRKCLVIYFNRC